MSNLLSYWSSLCSLPGKVVDIYSKFDVIVSRNFNIFSFCRDKIHMTY